MLIKFAKQEGILRSYEEYKQNKELTKQEGNTMKRRVIGLLLVMVCILSTNLVFAAGKTNQELPNKIIRDGKEFRLYEPSRKFNSAEPDFATTSDQLKTLNNKYRVIASDVALYVDYSHGKGGDQFAAGYVKATAPRFTARAEVWDNGQLDTTGTNNKNKGDTARASSYLAVYKKESRYARIFYNWK